jgi:hypothetical protein
MKQLLLTLSGFTMINLTILSVIVILKRPDCTKNRMLAYIILSPSLAVLFNLFRYLGILSSFPAVMALDYISNFAWSPVFLAYTVLMTGGRIVFRKRQLLHFIPLAAVFVFSVYLFAQPYGFRARFFSDLETGTPVFMYALDGVLMLQILSYLAASWRVARKHDALMKRSKNVSNLSLRWLQQFIAVYIGVSILAFIPIMLNPVPQSYLLFIPAAEIISFSFLVYKSVTSPAFLSRRDSDALEETYSAVKEKSAKPAAQEHPNTIPVRDADGFTLLKIEQIIHVKAVNKKTVITFKTGTRHSDWTLGEIEERSGGKLVRLHRNALGNPNFIRRVEKYFGGKYAAVFDNGDAIEISRRISSEIRKNFLS